MIHLFGKLPNRWISRNIGSASLSSSDITAEARKSGADCKTCKVILKLLIRLLGFLQYAKSDELMTYEYVMHLHTI